MGHTARPHARWRRQAERADHQHQDAFLNYGLYGLIVASPEPLPAPTVAGNADIFIRESATPLFHDPPAQTDSPFAVRFDPDLTRIEWNHSVQFTIDPARGDVCLYQAPDARGLTFDYLVPQILSFSLLSRGIESLHATVVARGDDAFAFVGDSGFGKSTLAAYLIKEGWKLATDDLLVIDNGCVPTGAHHIKLAPVTAADTIGQHTGLPMNDARGKCIYALPADRMTARSLPLRSIFMIEPDAAAVSSTRLHGKDAFREIAAAAFNPLNMSPARMQRHIRFVDSVLRDFPVLRLGVPRGIERIGKVVALLNRL